MLFYKNLADTTSDNLNFGRKGGEKPKALSYQNAGDTYINK